MSWNTSNTLELLGVIGTAFGAGVAWYKRRRITVATGWLLGWSASLSAFQSSNLRTKSLTSCSKGSWCSDTKASNRHATKS
jgi:uncharacterized membrane protein YfcA